MCIRDRVNTFMKLIRGLTPDVVALKILDAHLGFVTSIIEIEEHSEIDFPKFIHELIPPDILSMKIAIIEAKAANAKLKYDSNAEEFPTLSSFYRGIQFFPFKKKKKSKTNLFHILKAIRSPDKKMAPLSIFDLFKELKLASKIYETYSRPNTLINCLRQCTDKTIVGIVPLPYLKDVEKYWYEWKPQIDDFEEKDNKDSDTNEIE
eukprot:TRINITY_DN5666_c0_g1_i1.p1 TRINITY_DN5666_c0_g1~~TRINITY_DN5666_c0_g1_i1.p1  ORF type:complete len:206 (-),score=32.89 TRINITY_DN5666_c0_g1_i1:4-621(-)